MTALPKIRLFDTDVAEAYVEASLKHLDKFFEVSAIRTRAVYEELLETGSCAAFDHAIMECRSPSNSPQVRAEKAWEALAWQALVSPYYNEVRNSYTDYNAIVENIFDDPQSTYKFGVYVMREPHIKVYSALAHAESDLGPLYLAYCVNIMTARAIGREGDVALLWNLPLGAESFNTA